MRCPVNLSDHAVALQAFASWLLRLLVRFGPLHLLRQRLCALLGMLQCGIYRRMENTKEGKTL
jgi:hypothetical protein